MTPPTPSPVEVWLAIANLAAFAAVLAFVMVFGVSRSAWTTPIGRALLASRLGVLCLATGGAWRRVSEWTKDTSWNADAQMIVGAGWTVITVVVTWQTIQVIHERRGRGAAPLWPDQD